MMGAGAAIAVVALVTALLLGKKKKAGGGGDAPGTKGGGKVEPGVHPGTDVPSDVPVNPDSFNKGAVYGDPSLVPDDFDWNGNGLFIAEDCGTVAIARHFAPDPAVSPLGMLGAWNSGPTLNQTLAHAPTEVQTTKGPAMSWPSLYNFLIFAVDSPDMIQPEDAAWTVLGEIAPQCFHADPSEWGPGLVLFFGQLVDVCTLFYEEWRSEG